MRKDYEVTCQVDMCAERVGKVRVTTNLEAKAIKLAEEKLKKRWALSCVYHKMQRGKRLGPLAQLVRACSS